MEKLTEKLMTTNADSAIFEVQTDETDRTERENEYNDDALLPFVKEMMKNILYDEQRDIVVVCFGTMAISGDSLGPQVGTLLREKYNISAFVYGTEDCTVNGKNMQEWLSFIKQVHEGALFVAIDASLGEKSKVGQIVVRPDGVCPAGVKGKKSRFGDVGILGVVAQNSQDALMQLMTVSPLYVSKLADKVANMINIVLCCEQ